jgi:hypothetical protein
MRDTSAEQSDAQMTGLCLAHSPILRAAELLLVALDGARDRRALNHAYFTLMEGRAVTRSCVNVLAGRCDNASDYADAIIALGCEQSALSECSDALIAYQRSWPWSRRASRTAANSATVRYANAAMTLHAVLSSLSEPPANADLP